MGIRISDNGTWRDIKRVRLSDNGTWRDITRVRLSDNGTWREINLRKMDWVFSTDGMYDPLFDRRYWAGWGNGYPKFGNGQYWWQHLNTPIEPGDPDDLTILDGAVLDAIVSVFEPNEWMHYFVYFLNDWGDTAMDQTIAKLNADYKFILEGVNNSFSYTRFFADGNWGGTDNNQATLWSMAPATDDFQHLDTDSQYRYRIVPK